MKKIFPAFLLLFSQMGFAQSTWQWSRTGTGLFEAFFSAADNAGNVYGAGYNTGIYPDTFGSVTLPATGAGQTPVWVKYNASGAPLWAGCTGTGAGYLYGIATDPSGNLLVYGFIAGDSISVGPYVLHNPFGLSSYRYFLAKISAGGAVLWALADGNPYFYVPYPFLAANDGNGNVTTDDSGNVYITGEYRAATMTIGPYTLTNASGANTTTDIYVAKYSPEGTLMWATSSGGTNVEHPRGITVSATGNVYVTGDFNSTSVSFGPSVIGSASGYSMFIAKYSPGGAPLWAQASTHSNDANGIGLAHDNAGNVYVGGFFVDTGITLGAASATRLYPSAATYAATFVAKYNAADTVEWIRTVSASISSVSFYSIACAPCGQVWISGSYQQTIEFAPGMLLNVPMGTGVSPDPTFIAGYDFAGDALADEGLFSGGDDENQVACNAVGDVYLCGDYKDAMVVGTDTLATPPSEQFFIAKYGRTRDTVARVTHASLCGQDSVVLTAPGTGAYFQWNDSGITQKHTVHTPGTHWVLTSACGDTVTVDTFHVTNQPPGPITSNDTFICAYPFTIFNDSVAGGKWSCSASAIATIDSTTGAALAVLVPGTVIITYTLGACTVSKSMPTSVCEGAVHATPQNMPLVISPNPATDYLTIQTGPNTYTSCSLINNLGQVVITQTIVAAQTRVDISMLPAGIYYLRMSGEGDTRVEKVVKE